MLLYPVNFNWFLCITASQMIIHYTLIKLVLYRLRQHDEYAVHSTPKVQPCTLVHAFVTSRIAYCSVLLANAP